MKPGHLVFSTDIESIFQRWAHTILARRLYLLLITEYLDRRYEANLTRSGNQLLGARTLKLLTSFHICLPPLTIYDKNPKSKYYRTDYALSNDAEIIENGLQYMKLSMLQARVFLSSFNQTFGCSRCSYLARP